MVQAILFAFYFMTPRFHRSAPIRLLAAALLVMAAIKADQVYQMLGGLTLAPEFGFILSPFQWLMTPLLFLFVRAKTDREFALTGRDAIHLVPFLLVLLYYTSSYFVLGTAEKQALLADGWLRTVPNRILIPLLGDVTQLAYLLAALRLMNQYGVALKEWFSSVEKREMRWLKRILLIWVGVFIVHFFYVALRAAGGPVPFSLQVLDTMNVIHFVMVNVMALAAVADYFETPSAPGEISVLQKDYKAPALTQAERSLMFEKLQQVMQADRPYLDRDLTLKSLAGRMALTPRELSETINAEAGRNFFDYINNYRIRAAEQMLMDDTNIRVIDVAHDCGFNSKSVFNQAFKRHVGQTPTEFRTRHKL